MQLNINYNTDIFIRQRDQEEEKLEEDEEVVLDTEDIERRARNFRAKVQNENIRIFQNEKERLSTAVSIARETIAEILGKNGDSIDDGWVPLKDRDDRKYKRYTEIFISCERIINDEGNKNDQKKKSQRNAAIYAILILASMGRIISLRELRDPQLEIIANFIRYIVSDDFRVENVREVLSMYEYESLVENMMISLPTGQGKTAIGEFISLMALHGDFSQSFTMDHPMYANVLWDTYSKTLTNQAVADFTSIFSTDAFGCLYPLAKEIKPQSLITVGEGVKKPMLLNKYIIITTYEHGDIFTKGDMFEQLKKLTQTKKKEIDKRVTSGENVKMNYVSINDSNVTPLDTLRLCVIDEVHNINDGGGRGVKVDNVMIACRNMGIPMVILSGTIDEEVEKKLKKEFHFRTYVMEETSTKYERMVHFIKLKKASKNESVDGNNRTNRGKKNNNELYPNMMMMIYEALPYYIKWYISPGDAQRISFFVDNTKKLERCYAAFVAIAYSVIKPLKKLYLETVSMNYIKVPKIYFMWDKECLDTFRTYASLFNADEWLQVPEDNPYMVIVLGLRAGIMISHSNIFPSDDQGVRTAFENSYTRTLDDERSTNIFDVTDIVSPPFRILFSTSIISTGVNIRGLGLMFIDSTSFSMQTPSKYTQLIGRLGRYADGEIFVNVVNDEPESFMRAEEKTDQIMQNSELSERIFTMFSFKKMSDTKPDLFQHIEHTRKQRGGVGLTGDVNGFYTFNTSEILRQTNDDITEFNNFDYISYYEKNTRIRNIFESYDKISTAGKVPGKILSIMYDFFNDQRIADTLASQAKGDFTRPVLSTLLFLPFTYSVMYLFIKKGHVFASQAEYVMNFKRDFLPKDRYGTPYFTVSLIADKSGEDVYTINNYRSLLAGIINANETSSKISDEQVQHMTYMTSVMLATVFTNPAIFFDIWRNSIELLIHKMKAYLMSMKEIVSGMNISREEDRGNIKNYVGYHMTLLNNIIDQSYSAVSDAVTNRVIYGDISLEFLNTTPTDIPLKEYVKYYTLPTREVDGRTKTLKYVVHTEETKVLKEIKSHIYQIKK